MNSDKSTAKPRCVLFDVGGVLHNQNMRFWSDIQQRLGATDEQIGSIKRDLGDDFGKGLIDETDFWDQVASKYDLPLVPPKEMLFTRSFAEDLIPTPRVKEVLSLLRSHNIIPAIFSNTADPHATFLRDYGMYDGFDFVFLSNEIGYRKPDPEGFKYVLEQMQLEPAEVIFIDDLAENIEAAESLGISGIQLSDNTKLFEVIEAALTRI